MDLGEESAKWKVKGAAHFEGVRRVWNPEAPEPKRTDPSCAAILSAPKQAATNRPPGRQPATI
jgi:hypothetical protein